MPQNRKFPKSFSEIKTARKICCLFLAVVMTVMMMPLTAWAAETGGELKCTHMHDTSCGYSAEAQTACNHKHTDECYTLSTGNTGAQLNVSVTESEASTAGDSSSSVAGSAEGGSSSSTAGSSSSDTSGGSSSSSTETNGSSSSATTPQCNCGVAEGEEHKDGCPLYIEMPTLMMSMLGASDTTGTASPAPESTTDVTQISTNKYEVTTRLYMDKAKAAPNDIVLILDSSGTMMNTGSAGYATTFAEAKAAAIQMVDTLLANPNNRVAVTWFASNWGDIIGYRDSTKKQEIIDAINAAQPKTGSQDSGTNTQGGLHAAREMIKKGARTNVNSVTILLTDGKANLSAGVIDSATNYPSTNLILKSASQKKYTPGIGFSDAIFNYTTSYSSGSSTTTNTRVDGQWAYIVNDVYYGAVVEADYLKKTGSKLYCIGYNLAGEGDTTEAVKLLKEISTDGSAHEASKGGLKDVMAQVTGLVEKDAFTNGTISNMIAPGWRLDESFTPQTVSSSYTAAGTAGAQNITWSIPKIASSTKGVAGLKYNSDSVLYAELKYRIIVDDTTKAKLPGYSSLTDPANDTTKYPVINSAQTVSYTDSLGSTAAMPLADSPQPAITTQTPTLNEISTLTTAVSGSAETSSKINIAFPNNNTASATADASTGSFSAQIPTGVTLAKGDSVTATAKNGDKLTSLPKSVTVTQPVSGKLIVNKTVRGSAADVSKVFAFTLTLKKGGAKDEALTLPYTGISVTSGSLKADANGVYTFSLSNGQGISISGIPVGYTYEITEDKGSYVQTLESGSASASGTIDVNDKTVSFVNTLNYVVPTGIVQDYLPYMLIILAVIAWFALWRKFKKDKSNSKKDD